tara:strand:- start:514 stop:735 length:222 start_codon:yes stop_codon:yes gene_type:complete
MPIYEYKCSCGKEFETIQRMNDDKLEVCNKDVLECEGDGELTRLINKPLILSDDIGRGTKRMTDKDLYKELDE